MNVYLDELPKSCKECPCFEYNEYWDKCYCSGRGEIEDKYKKPQDCHLLSLSDYTKQVRKEVCKIFREAINECRREYYQEFLMHSNPIKEKYYRGYDFIRARTLEVLLDQIQGEQK